MELLELSRWSFKIRWPELAAYEESQLVEVSITRNDHSETRFHPLADAREAAFDLTDFGFSPGDKVDVEVFALGTLGHSEVLATSFDVPETRVVGPTSGTDAVTSDATRTFEALNGFGEMVVVSCYPWETVFELETDIGFATVDAGKHTALSEVCSDGTNFVENKENEIEHKCTKPWWAFTFSKNLSETWDTTRGLPTLTNSYTCDLTTGGELTIGKAPIKFTIDLALSSITHIRHRFFHASDGTVMVEWTKAIECC